MIAVARKLFDVIIGKMPEPLALRFRTSQSKPEQLSAYQSADAMELVAKVILVRFVPVVMGFLEPRHDASGARLAERSEDNGSSIQPRYEIYGAKIACHFDDDVERGGVELNFNCPLRRSDEATTL